MLSLTTFQRRSRRSSPGLPQLRPSTVQRDKITRQLAGLGDVGFSFASPGSLDIVEAVAQALPPPAATTGAAAGGSPGRVRSIDGPDTALLERALAIAREKGDDAAQEKIEEKLRELRSLS